MELRVEKSLQSKNDLGKKHVEANQLIYCMADFSNKIRNSKAETSLAVKI